MAYTFLSASLTKTYLAPCSLTHLVVHSPAWALAPLTPHWLSEIHPVQLLSAAMVIVAANKVAAAVIVASRSFISPPPRNCSGSAVRLSSGLCVSLAQSGQRCPEPGCKQEVKPLDRMRRQEKRGIRKRIPPFCGCVPSEGTQILKSVIGQ